MSSERPIIFSGDMVTAILAGRKTMTRRIVKPQPPDGGRVALRSSGWVYVDCNGDALGPAYCPYAAPRLWVREAWRVNGNEHDYANATRDNVFYRADEPWNTNAGWKPSIHMPRWASRITLQITDVRVERVQDITDDDALAEGVDRTNSSIPGYATQRFQKLWDSINAARGYPWAANPVVWVIEFRKVES